MNPLGGSEMSRGLLDTGSLVNGILGFVRLFCRAKRRLLPCHQRGISILSGIQRRQTSTTDQIACAQLMKSLPLLMPGQLRATTMLQRLIRNNPTSVSLPRPPTLLLILVREVFPEFEKYGWLCYGFSSSNSLMRRSYSFQNFVSQSWIHRA
jgi:hypothetical protein